MVLAKVATSLTQMAFSTHNLKNSSIHKTVQNPTDFSYSIIVSMTISLSDEFDDLLSLSQEPLLSSVNGRHQLGLSFDWLSGRVPFNELKIE